LGSKQTPSAPTRNSKKKKQRVTAILFTPNHRPEQRGRSNSSSPSPTPASRTGAASVFETPADSGLDEPEQALRGLNLNDPVHPRLHGEGPLHGMPGRKGPSRKRPTK